MLKIKHTLCPSCSVGCGINVVLNDGEIVGTFPYKRHPINEGKNCLNGRNSIDMYTNKFEEDVVSNCSKSIDEAKEELKSVDPSEVTVIASGNNTIEEIEAIKDFAQTMNYNIGFYADNLKNFEDVASYDDIETAESLFVIGDLLYENPLLGRRIVHAKQNGATVTALCKSNSVISNIADNVSDKSVIEFLDENKSNINESSVIVFNQIDTSEDLDKIEEIFNDSKCKILPVFSKTNTKGTLGLIDAKSKEEMLDLLSNTKVLLVFNDDIVDELDFDYSKISKIISFAPCENKTTEISNIIIPIKTWLEQDGSFVNAMGQSQNFTKIIDSDALSEIEIIDTLKN
jgi:formate dehydrogenase major subunit